MAIPKRIITIWLSDNEEMPELIRKCINTHQHQIHNGYEHLFVGLKDVPKDSTYLNECVRTKQWAKATDFLRIKLLNELGGIYLDADVEIIKQFDDLIEQPMFCGMEENLFVSNAIIGSEAGHPILSDYLGKVERNFLGGGDLIYQPGMYLWTEIVKYSNGVRVYPPEYFLPYNHHMDRLLTTDNTYCIHHFSKSWIKLKQNNMNFSVCLITRNEEKTLPKCLESLKEFQDRGGEICILDTGSTDGTVDIAKKAGCKVEEVGEMYLHLIDESFAKRINDKFIINGEEPIVVAGDKYFDFASARNHAASLSTKDMVSFVDADEVFTRMDIDKLNDLIKKGITQFEYNFVFAHDSFGNEAIKFVQSKFYDRRIIKWTGLVHEILSGNGNRMMLDESIFKLEHWQNQETGRHTYLKGLSVDCFNNPESDRNSHYFARELMWNGRPASAIKEFERHILMNKWLEERSQSMVYVGDCYGMLNKPEQQVEWYNKAFYIDNSRREPLLKLARFYHSNKNYMSAICYATACMEIQWGSFYGNNKSHYTYEPHEILYSSYGWIGNIKKAQEHLMKALEYLPLEGKYLHDTRFYFEYHDVGINGWMSFPELLWLFNTSKNMRSIAEIGSWKGRSTHALLSGCKGKVTAIDHFQGSGEKDNTHGAVGVFEEFSKNLQGFNNLEVKKTDSLTAASEGKKYDMVFIDGGHTYDEVVKDIRAWKNNARVILCGHDHCNAWPEVIRAVKDELGDVYVNDSIWYKYMVPTVSIIIPQLGRIEGLKRCLDSIEKLNYPKELIEIKIIEGNDSVPIKIKRGVEETSGKYIVYASNDIEFEPDSLINALDSGKGLVAFNTGTILPDEGNICEHFIIRRDLIPLLGGEIFDTDFNHVGCDNLLWAKCKMLKEAERSDTAIVKHHHFSKGASFDKVYEKGWEKMAEDREKLEIKMKHQWKN